MQGHLTEAQETVLRDVVKARLRGNVRGHKVYDLGAGSCHLSRILLDLGASEVVAIDRNPKPDDLPYLPNLSYQQAYFHELDPITDGIVFLSWPQQYVQGLVRLVRQAPTLVYLGCNTDMSACAPTKFWEYIQWRSIKHHVPHKHNTLLVYGDELGPRELVLEEIAGKDRTLIYHYEEQDNG